MLNGTDDVTRRQAMDNREEEDFVRRLDDYVRGELLWERLAGLFSGIAIGVLAAIFAIVPAVRENVFQESPWLLIFAVILALIVLFELQVMTVLRNKGRPPSEPRERWTA